MPSPCSAEIGIGSPRPRRRPRARRPRRPCPPPCWRPARPACRACAASSAKCASSGVTPARASITKRLRSAARIGRSRSARACGRRGCRGAASSRPAVSIDGETQVAELRLALAAVAGDARRVVDQRQPPADQPVEQRRLADIRPADDGDTEGRLPPSTGSRQPAPLEPSGCASGFGGVARRGAKARGDQRQHELRPRPEVLRHFLVVGDLLEIFARRR